MTVNVSRMLAKKEEKYICCVLVELIAGYGRYWQLQFTANLTRRERLYFHHQTDPSVFLTPIFKMVSLII